MKEIDGLRRDVRAMVEELRATLQQLDGMDVTQPTVVTDARDRLRFVSELTEQAAVRTLTSAERILERLRAQQAQAGRLQAKSRSPEIRAFLERLLAEHEEVCGQAAEIIQAQAFQDLVGQVIGKLLVTVQKLEENLAHLLIDEEAEGQLAGPAVRDEDRVSQDDIDELFG